MLIALALAALATVDVEGEQPQEFAQVTVLAEGAQFSIPGYRNGSWFALTPSFRLDFQSGVFVSLAEPVVLLEIVGRQSFTPGDLTAVLGYRIIRSERATLDISAWSMWPLTDSHNLVGTAHLLLGPVLAGRYRLGQFTLGTDLSLRGAVPFGPHGDHNHQSLFVPHDTLDVRAVVSGAWQPVTMFTLHADLRPVVVPIPHPLLPVGHRLSASAGATFRFGWASADLAVVVPVSQARTEDFRVAVSLAIAL